VGSERAVLEQLPVESNSEHTVVNIFIFHLYTLKLVLTLHLQACSTRHDAVMYSIHCTQQRAASELKEL